MALWLPTPGKQTKKTMKNKLKKVIKKKLKIQFWKAEEALAMQIIEQDGLQTLKEEGMIRISATPYMQECFLYLRGCDDAEDLLVDVLHFSTNNDRDKYLKVITNAITDELFTGGRGELKVGEMCEVRDTESDKWGKKILLAILPEKYQYRFLAESNKIPECCSFWKFARPISKRTEPKIEECGNVVTYTWEE